MILRPVSPASPLGPPVTKRPVGLTDSGVLVQHAVGHDVLDHVLDDVGADLGLRRRRVSAGSRRRRFDAHGLAIVVLDRDLALAVGPQVGQMPSLRTCGQAAAQLVGQHDGQGHQFGRLVAGKADHHALVAGAGGLDLVLAHLATLGLQRLVDAQGDVGALLLDARPSRRRSRRQSHTWLGCSRCPGSSSRTSVVDIDVGFGGDLAGHQNQAGGDDALAGHAGVGVLGKDGVQHGVRDLVADLVRMPLGDRFRGEKVLW